MKILQRLIIMLGLLSLVSGCYWGISGRVIDAETQQPIEGAVVLVEWTKSHGIGLTYTDSYKAVETVSDKDGKVRFPGCYSPFVNPPSVTVYKKGYVAWNNENVFPDYKKRADYEWKNNYIFKLLRFKSEYSYNDHVSFIGDSIHSWSATEKKNHMKKAFEWEVDEAFKERRNKPTKEGGVQ